LNVLTWVLWWFNLNIITFIFELWEQSLVFIEHTFIALCKILDVFVRIFHLMKLHIITLVFELKQSLVVPEHTFITLGKILNVLIGILLQLDKWLAWWRWRMSFIWLFIRFDFNWFAYFFCWLSLIFLSGFRFLYQCFYWLSLIACSSLVFFLRNLICFVIVNLGSRSWNVSCSWVNIQSFVLFLNGILLIGDSWVGLSFHLCNDWFNSLSSLYGLRYGYVGSRHKVRCLICHFGSIN